LMCTTPDERNRNFVFKDLCLGVCRSN